MAWLERSDQSTMIDTMKQVIVGLNALRENMTAWKGLIRRRKGSALISPPYQIVFLIMYPVWRW